MKAKRADNLFRPSNIVNDIWEMTKKATVVLADLTGKNPNVFYELGLAHAIKKPAILITGTMDDVPFDLQSLRVIKFDKNLPNWGETLKTDITKFIQETIESPNKSIPATFFDAQRESKHTVTEYEKQHLALSQKIEGLTKEIRQIQAAYPTSVYGGTTFESSRGVPFVRGVNVSRNLGLGRVLDSNLLKSSELTSEALDDSILETFPAPEISLDKDTEEK